MNADNLEKVLTHTDKTVEFRKEMESIELVCNYEFNGSSSLKDLHILVIILSSTFNLNISPCFY